MAERKIACPYCNAKLSLEESYLGSEIQCPVCSKSFVAAAPETSTSRDEELEKLKQQGKAFAQNLVNFSKPLMSDLAEKGKKLAQDAVTDLNKKRLEDDTETLDDRKILLKFFEKIKPELPLKSDMELNKFCFMSAKQYAAFERIQENDHAYWQDLNILERFGKKNSQLVAEPYMMTSPLTGVTEGDNGEAKVAFYIDKEKRWHLANTLVYITKLYTFENQLFAYRAIWDYVAQCVWHEETDAFFFKDITNISTSTIYGSAVEKLYPSIVLPIIIGILALILAPFTVGFSILLGLLIIIAYYILKTRKRKRSIRRVELFDIESSSGSTFQISMLSDEWLTFKRNLYNKKANLMEGVNQDHTARSKQEKIVHSIRKMIEEKKVGANE